MSWLRRRRQDKKDDKIMTTAIRVLEERQSRLEQRVILLEKEAGTYHDIVRATTNRSGHLS